MCGCSFASPKSLSTESTINSMAYGGENLIPVDVPCNVLKFFSRTERYYALKQFL